MTFGTLLRSLREKQGVGIKKLAPDLDVSYTYLSKLENDRVSPSTAVVERVANYFEYNRDALLLAADKIPADVLQILKNNPEEAIEYLRKEYSKARVGADERKFPKHFRKSK